jgi:multicomponent Na+:H+ antiporter subunit C
MDSLYDLILARFNYWIYVVLLMIGLYAMITKKNLIKKLIGMSIFQTAIILFFVSVGVKKGATIPIISHHEEHGTEQAGDPADGQDAPHAVAAEANAGRTDQPVSDLANPRDEEVDSDTIVNPLPHVLMLTAIVVGVATLGVGLAVAQKIFIRFRSLEEDEILDRIRTSDG